MVMAQRGQVPAAHHRLLIARLQAVAERRDRRLMVLMPPGAAKSTYVSVLFPAWLLQAWPQASIIACSHTAALARYFGTQVRGMVRAQAARLGLRMARHAAGAAWFETIGGGSYYAVGVRGPVTGRRADLLIIDDPVKSHAEAASLHARADLFNWYRADLLTRLRPGGAVVLVMTRWHQDDLAGRLMASDDDWQVLRLPALAEADDPLGRVPGAALWPEWEDATALQRRRTALGRQVWQALYQQAPMTEQHAVFSGARWQFCDSVPSCTSAIRAWDLAATDGIRADYTVGVKLGRTRAGGFVVLDVVRARLGPAAVEKLIRATAEADGPAVRISLPLDPGQAGRAQGLYLARLLAGFTVQASAEAGAKTLRARPLAAQAEAGNVSLLRAGWTDMLLAELGSFPHGEHDDQVDALSRAFTGLANVLPPARRVDLALLAR